MDVSNLPPGHIDGGGQQPHSFSDASPVSAQAEDDILKPPRLDGGAQKKALDGQPTPDTLAPDSLAPKPDTGVQPPGVGGPCPCAAGQLCINNVCRATCAPPTDPCKAKAVCPANNACLQTNGSLWVCVPATAMPGQPCANKWCPVDYVCGAAGLGSPYRCLPTCTGAGTPCGTGGTCVTSRTGCSFCSSN